MEAQLMQSANTRPDVPRPAELLLNWLTAQMRSLQFPNPDQQYPPLPRQTRSERITLLRALIDGDRPLAHAVRRLPVYEQMRLTVEMLATNVVLEPARSRIVHNPAITRVAAYHRIQTCLARYVRRLRQ
jgi:hypothetical protein